MSKKKYPPSAIELAGQRAWNEAWSHHATVSRRSFLTAIAGVAVGAVGVGAAVWRSAQPTAVPWLINRDGPLQETARLVASVPDANRISGHLAMWVMGWRTVMVDNAYQRKLIDQTYAWTDSQSIAIDKLGLWYVGHRPAERAKTETVDVVLTTAPIPQGGAVWQADWKETSWAREQGKTTIATTWRASITVKIQAPVTDAEIQANWDGVFVEDFAFRQVMS